MYKCAHISARSLFVTKVCVQIAEICYEIFKTSPDVQLYLDVVKRSKSAPAQDLLYGRKTVNYFNSRESTPPGQFSAAEWEAGSSHVATGSFQRSTFEWSALGCIRSRIKESFSPTTNLINVTATKFRVERERSSIQRW